MSLSNLKRDAASGKISLELVEHYGKIGKEIPERMRGIRKISKVNTVGIFLINGSGVESELRLDSAKLVEYDGKSIVIYEAAQREPTQEERNVLNEWKKISENLIAKNPFMDKSLRGEPILKYIVHAI